LEYNPKRSNEPVASNEVAGTFNPEGSGYDYETAKAAGLDPKDIVRTELYPGEDKYFKENPNVGGMMTEDNRVIINPYSNLSDKEKDAIRINESIRLIFKQENIVPNIEITDEQREFFKGTPYETNEEAIKQTIMARILTNDPSAKATKDQLEEANKDVFKAIQENIDHWGSVVPASKTDKAKYNLPEESYMIVKGKAHKTFNKAVQGEEDRGFEVKKFGNRYYSIPKGSVTTSSTDIMDKIAMIESGNKHTDAKGNLTKSKVGALGKYQIMPETARDPGYGITPIPDLKKAPESEHKRFATEYFAKMLELFNNDEEKALAAYNAGPKAVMDAVKKDPNNWKRYIPKESKDYIVKVSSL
jgi:hypothetical protein